MGNKGGFSWKRLSGVTRAKQRISRKTGVPLSKFGRQRKYGKMMGCGCIILFVVFTLVLFSSLAIACSTFCRVF